mmetsp:Transcript_116504/g.250291  ORF Transcript_116504/g.250291 Transcript_116504/m.250291 type:complete len:137 (-) Transcript_116504:113-523(-)
MKLDQVDFNGRTLRVSEANNKGGDRDSGKDRNSRDSRDRNAGPDTLKLNDLPNHATEEDVRKEFEKYGPLRRVKLFLDKGFGFVSYEDSNHASKAAHKSDLCGSDIRVELDDQPRGGGDRGGFRGGRGGGRGGYRD